MIELQWVECEPTDKGATLLSYNTWAKLQYRTWKIDLGFGNRMGPSMHRSTGLFMRPSIGGPEQHEVEWTEWKDVRFRGESR